MTETPKLEDLVQFPALIPVKAISEKGVDPALFQTEMTDLTAQLVPGFHGGLLTLRASSNGNYHAVTLSITFQSMKQFHAVDEALKAHVLVRMVL